MRSYTRQMDEPICGAGVQSLYHCSACLDPFVPRHRMQRTCGRPECKAERNRQRNREWYARRSERC